MPRTAWIQAADFPGTRVLVRERKHRDMPGWITSLPKRKKNCCGRVQNNRYKTVSDQTATSMEIQAPACASQHVEDHVQEEAGQGAPPNDHTKVNFLSKKLEQSKQNEEDEGAREVSFLVELRIHPKRVQDGQSSSSNLRNVDTQLCNLNTRSKEQQSEDDNQLAAPA